MIGLIADLCPTGGGVWVINKDRVEREGHAVGRRHLAGDQTI